MQLIGMLDSPYVRRVAISLRLLGLDFEHRPISVFRTYEQFSEINGRDVLARLQLERRRDESVGRGNARKQCRCRGHDDPRRSASEPVKGPGARGRHAHVRLEAAIRIDFVRRVGENGAV